MKNTKRFAALLLALIMVFALAVPAMAEDSNKGSITVSKAIPGTTYTAYRVFDLESYNTTTKAYSYTVADGWADFVDEGGSGAAYVTVNDKGYVTWNSAKNSDTDKAEFAKLALAYAQQKKIAASGSATCADGANSVTISNLPLGYYVINSTVGSLCILTTTQPNASVEEKNGVPSSEKKVEEDSDQTWGDKNDADIGQTVNFKATITAQAGAENYVFHDKMSAGLTYTGVDRIELTSGTTTTTVAASNYTVKTTGFSDDCTFEVVFTQDFCDTLKANDQIVIYYTALLNSGAVVGNPGNPNNSHLSYGDENHTKNTPDSSTVTYTWDVDVFKYTEKDGQEVALAGAVFELRKSETGAAIKLVKVSETEYRVATAAEITANTNVVTQITTGSTGKFTIKGLDSDTYYLVEITAPEGYNKVDPITVKIDSNGKTYIGNSDTEVAEVKVLNQTGAELPSTGGIGTTVFYIVGAILVVGAAVLLVTKKRMSNNG